MKYFIIIISMVFFCNLEGQTMVLKNSKGCGSDERCKALSTNQDNFLDGDLWEGITAAEYSNLNSSLTGTTFSGATDAQITATSSTSSGLTNTVSVPGRSVDVNDWVVAIKIKVSNLDDANIKLGYANTSNGMVQIPGNLPDGGPVGERYFVYTGDFQNTKDGSIPAIYNDSGTYTGGSGGVRYWGSGNTNTLFNFNNSTIVAIQMLTTDTKQW